MPAQVEALQSPLVEQQEVGVNGKMGRLVEVVGRLAVGMLRDRVNEEWGELSPYRFEGQQLTDKQVADLMRPDYDLPPHLQIVEVTIDEGEVVGSNRGVKPRPRVVEVKTSMDELVETQIEEQLAQRQVDREFWLRVAAVGAVAGGGTIWGRGRGARMEAAREIEESPSKLKKALRLGFTSAVILEMLTGCTQFSGQTVEVQPGQGGVETDPTAVAQEIAAKATQRAMEMEAEQALEEEQRINEESLAWVEREVTEDNALKAVAKLDRLVLPGGLVVDADKVEWFMAGEDALISLEAWKKEDLKAGTPGAWVFALVRAVNDDGKEMNWPLMVRFSREAGMATAYVAFPEAGADDSYLAGTIDRETGEVTYHYRVRFTTDASGKMKIEVTDLEQTPDGEVIPGEVTELQPTPVPTAVPTEQNRLIADWAEGDEERAFAVDPERQNNVYFFNLDGYAGVEVREIGGKELLMAMDDEGNLLGVYDKENKTAVELSGNQLEIDGVNYEWQEGEWVELVAEIKTGFLVETDSEGDSVYNRYNETGELVPALKLGERNKLMVWDEKAGEFVLLKVRVYTPAGSSEQAVKAQEILVSDLGLVAVDAKGNALVAMTDQGTVVPVTDNVAVFETGRMAWDAGAFLWRDGFRAENQKLMQFDTQRRQYQPVMDADNQPLSAEEIILYQEYQAVIANHTLTAIIDANWNVMPAVNGELPLGWQAVAYSSETNSLKPTGESWFDWMVRQETHDTIAVETDKSPGLGVSVTIAERSFGPGCDWDMSWNGYDGQEKFSRYWQEIIRARMQDDGLIDRGMTHTEFLAWLKAGNQITFKQLSAWNATTGEVEVFENVPINQIKVYVTAADAAAAGQPELPFRTRYQNQFQDSIFYDSVYSPATGDLWLVMQSTDVSLDTFTSQYAQDASYKMRDYVDIGSGLVRVSYSVLLTNVKGEGKSGRVYFKSEVVLSYANTSIEWLRADRVSVLWVEPK